MCHVMHLYDLAQASATTLAVQATPLQSLSIMSDKKLALV